MTACLACPFAATQSGRDRADPRRSDPARSITCGLIALGDHNINAPASEGGGPATGAGNDTIVGGTADELLIGDSSVADAGITAAGNDRIDGGDGHDLVFGDNVNFEADRSAGSASGNDKLDGCTGDDTLKAGPGNDALDGGANVDECNGEVGIDTAKRCETLTEVP